MDDIAQVVASEQCFSVEYEDFGTYRHMSVRFWKGDKLCRVFICRSKLPSSQLTGELGWLSRFLSVVSTRADVVACSGCSVDFVRTLDHCSYFPRGVQSCSRFEHLSLFSLMHTGSYSVFGKIDFFSVLQALLVPLGGSQTEHWVLESPELQRVSEELAVMHRFRTRGSYFIFILLFQAITSCKIDLRSLPTMCTELVNQWKTVRTYLTVHSARQEGQGVRSRVSYLS